MNIWVGSRELLHNLNFTIQPGQKVGLVGSNGSGKSTLINTFKLSDHDRKLHYGDSLQLAPVRMAWVEQEVPNVSDLALDYTINGDLEYTKWQQILEQAIIDNDQTAIIQANAKLDEIDAWTIRSRAAVILTGLGFTEQQMQQPVNSLSGGWRIRLNLARALLVPSELLLLDEPTNHLDIDAIFWLENYLQKYNGTIVFISHDQEFMDNLADHILHIDNGTISEYTGNYESFTRQRTLKLEQQQKSYEQQQKYIERMERFITRFKAKATKAKQAQSRQKQLDKVARIDPVLLGSPFNFKFLESDRLPSVLSTIRQANIGYISGKPVLTKVNFSLLPGMRVGLLGVNGAGKSTLIKALAGDLEVLDNVGVIERSPLVKIGYFNQYVVDTLDLEADPVTLMRRLDSKLLENDIRKFLAGFNFKGDKVFEKVDKFSGGEKSRLALALIVYQKPNLLLLDEPTNHLDLEMRQALIDALQDFSGSLVVVSHDRFLLSTVVDEFYLVRQGTVTPFDGDLSDYHNIVIEDTKALKQQANADFNQNLNANNTNSNSINGSNASSDNGSSLTNDNSSNNSNPAQSQDATARVLADTRLARQLKRELLPLTQIQQKLSEQINQINEQLTQITNSYLDPQIASNGVQIQQLAKQEKELNLQKEELEEQWLELEMEVEELTTAFVAKYS